MIFKKVGYFQRCDILTTRIPKGKERKKGEEIFELKTANNCPKL